ncbi:MAG: hypothetical protein LBT66_01630 [Methanobrevibacter sp.]|jgi:hypothetical protein|nr:hypothetical protein [Candidatus Methanovirga meridionalis]
MTSRIPNLLDDFKKFEKIIKNHDLNNDELDLSQIDFLTPTILLPSINFAENINIKNYIVNDKTDHCIKSILGLEEPIITSMPYKKFTNKNNIEIDSKFSDQIKEYGGVNATQFLIGEMINNIHDHSDFTIGYALAQLFPNIGVADISFMDNGVSIPGRFEEYGFEFKNDCDAIHQAINGRSTAIKNEEMRGTGLNSTIRLVTEGNKGSILIASRNGACYINEKEINYKSVEDKYIKGTLISIRVRKNSIDIYPYMEKTTFKK